jgi:hypothetical protein
MRFFEIHFWTPLRCNLGVKSALDSFDYINESRADLTPNFSPFSRRWFSIFFATERITSISFPGDRIRPSRAIFLQLRCHLQPAAAGA